MFDHPTDNLLVVIHNLLDCHIDSHLLEQSRFITNILHDLDLGKDLLSLIQEDILHVYHHLAHRNVVPTT